MRLIALMLVAGFAALLLFGCLAGMKERQQTQQPAQPSSQVPGGSVGDAEISPGQPDEDIEVPGEDLLPPPPQGDAVNVPASSLDDSLVDIDISEEDAMISEEDFVVPP